MPPARTSRFAALATPRGKKVLLLVGNIVAALFYLWAAWVSRLNLSNIDGISYMSIAKQYAHGQASYAVNAYWSPWVSWLMAPPIAVGADPLTTFMFVNALAGIIGTAMATWIVWRLSGGQFWATVISLASAFTLYLSVAWTITPDAWVVTWVIVFTFALIEIDAKLRPGTAKQRIVAGIILGALGVVGYVTKQYLIPVFVVVTIIWLVVRMIAERHERPDADRRAMKRSWVSMPVTILVTFLVVAAPWVGALSVKYHEFTLGTSAAVNVSSKFDPTSDATANAPQNLDPLQLPTPPNKYAVAYNEDRSVETTDGADTTTKASLASRLKFYLEERVNVFPYYLQKIASFAPFAWLTVAAFVLALALGFVRFARFRPAVWVATVWVVYFAGYAAITQVSSGGGNVRYYWPLLPLSAMLLSLMIPPIWSRFAAAFRDRPGWKWRRALAVVLIAIIPFSAATQGLLGFPAPFQYLRSSPGVGYLIHAPLEPTPYSFSQQLIRDRVIPDHSKMVGTNYRMTLRLAWYLDGQVYGTSGHNYDITNPAFQKVLTKNGIDYFITYTPVGSKQPDAAPFATLVKSYTTNISCSDLKGANIVPCHVDILKLNDK